MHRDGVFRDNSADVLENMNGGCGGQKGGEAGRTDELGQICCSTLYLL